MWLALAGGLALAPGAAPAQDPAETELSRYDQLRRDIERAGRAGRTGALMDLVLKIDGEMEEPAPLPVTACWQHLKSTVLIELDRRDEAKASLKLLAETCPTWETLNNLAVLEAGDGEYGPAKNHLLAAIDRATAPEKARPRANLAAVLSEDEQPFLTLEGQIQECTATPDPKADCEGKLLLRAVLTTGGSPVPATFEVFEEADQRGQEVLAEKSQKPVPSFEVPLPEGRYRVVANADLAVGQGEALVSSGTTSTLTLALGAGQLQADWRLAPGTDTLPATFRFENAAESSIADASEPGSDGFTAIVPAGSYRITAEDGPLRQTKTASVIAGEESSVELDSGVAQALDAWRRAWESGQAERFIETFADGFTPDSETSHDDWKADRRKKIGEKGRISVGVGEVDFSRVAPHRVTASFTQDYEACMKPPSKRKVCDSGTKRLTFEWTERDWKIVGQEWTLKPGSKCPPEATCE